MVEVVKMLFRRAARAGHRWVVAIWFCAANLRKNPKSIIRYAVFIAFVLFAFSLLWESSKRELTIGGLLDTMTYGYLSSKGRQIVREQLRLVALELAELQHGLDVSPHDIHKLGKQIEFVNEIIRSVQEDAGDTNSGNRPVLKKQEVCPEVFSEKGSGYARHVKCKEFVPMHQLITLLMYAPNKFPKLSMSYLEMMQGVAKHYPEIRVILATSQAVQEADAILKLDIKFKNEIIAHSNEGSMWSRLLAQVETPYVLVAPRITHFDDDVDLYRLVRVLSYRDDVAVAGGSYRNVTAQWDLGCRQASFDYWTAKYSSGYYHSIDECVVCDYLPGPFAAKTKVLKELDFDGSLSRGAFHDLFWRLQRRGMTDNTAVVCPDVMFNIDTPRTTDVDYAAFANKHEIKKVVEPNGRVRWYGCRRGLSYTKGRECSWSDGMGVPPCDLWNLGEVIKFVMLACEEAQVSCEYAAGTVLGESLLVKELHCMMMVCFGRLAIMCLILDENVSRLRLADSDAVIILNNIKSVKSLKVCMVKLFHMMKFLDAPRKYLEKSAVAKHAWEYDHHPSVSCYFEVFENLLVRVFPKLHSKPCYYLYKF